MPINEDLIPETTPEQKRTVGRFGEKTTVDKETFEIKGIDSGTVYGQGSNLQEALALQVAGASGSSPTVAGRPDLLATEQRPGVPVETIEGADGQQVMPTVATPAELTQRSLGTLPSFNAVTGTQEDITLPEAPEVPEAPKPLTDYATALKETIASGIESKKQELLGAPDDYDNQILRQKGALMTKLLGQDLTPDELKWLTPSQSSAIVSGDTKLIEAELAGLNTIVQGRKEMKKEAEEKALSQFDLFLRSGADPDSLPQDFLTGLDSQLGLPEGTFENIYKSEYAEDEAVKEAAALVAAQNMYSFLSTLPVGETVTIDGIDYQSLNKGTIQMVTEDDGMNTTIFRVNQDTGEQLDPIVLKGVSSSSGWVFEEQNGVGLRKNTKTGEVAVVYDLNLPNQGIANPVTLKETFPDGYKPTDSDLALMGLTQLDSSTGGIQCGQYARYVTGYEGGSLTEWSAKKALIDPDIGTSDNPPQAGDAFIQSGGSFGHIGVVLGVNQLEDGSWDVQVTDANAKSDGAIRYTTINSKSILGFAREGFGLRSEFAFGTDSSDDNASIQRFLASEEEELTKAPTIKDINGRDMQWDPGTQTWIPPGLEVTAATITSDNKKATEITNIINELAAIENVGKYLGRITVIPDILKSEDQIDFENKVNRLKNFMTLDNLGLMTGILTDKDIEILASAATELSLRGSKEAFQAELTRIYDEMNRETTPEPPPDTETTSTQSQGLAQFKITDMEDPRIIQALNSDDYSVTQNIDGSVTITELR